jgi:hypothetical protein
MSVRAVQSAHSLSHITADAVSTGSSFKNDNKYYPGLESIREMKIAQQLFDAYYDNRSPDEAARYAGLIRLYGLPRNMDSLYTEMMSTEATIPFVKEILSGDGSNGPMEIIRGNLNEWEKNVIIEYRGLYSDEVHGVYHDLAKLKTYLTNDRRAKTLYRKREVSSMKKIRLDVLGHIATQGTLLFSCLGRQSVET